MSVETEHFGNPPEQTTVKRVTVTDAVGEDHTYAFEGPPGGPYEYADEGDPSEAALRELFEHVDEADQVAHDHPDDDGDGGEDDGGEDEA